MKHVEIFTDGACQGNPGPGGWGAILRFNGIEKEISGGDPATTNNRMELTGNSCPAMFEGTLFGNPLQRFTICMQCHRKRLGEKVETKRLAKGR